MIGDGSIMHYIHTDTHTHEQNYHERFNTIFIKTCLSVCLSGGPVSLAEKGKTKKKTEM